jgi:hypothetical protein
VWKNPSIIEICTSCAIDIVFDTGRIKAIAAILCAVAYFAETDQNIREEIKHMHFGKMSSASSNNLLKFLTPSSGNFATQNLLGVAGNC